MRGIIRPNAPNKLTLPLLILVASFSIPHVSSIAPFLTEMSEEFDVSDGLTGQFGTMSFVGTFLIAVGLTPFVQRMSLRRLMVIAAYIVGISTVLTAVFPSFWAVMVTRLLAGIGAGIITSGVLASVPRAWSDPAARAKHVGLIVAAFAGGPGIWSPIMKYIGDGSSWEAAVIVYGIISVIVGVVAFSLLPALPGGGGATATLAQRIKTSTRLIWYPVLGQVFLNRAIVRAGLGSITTFIAVFTIYFYPGSDEWIGFMLAAVGLGFIAAATISGFLISRFKGPAGTAVYFGFGLTATTALISWVTPDPAVTTALLFLFGGCAAMVMTATQLLIFQHSGEHQASAVFMSGAIAPLGNVIGAIIAGIAVDASTDLTAFRWLFTAIGVAVVIPALLAARQIRNQRAIETGCGAD